MQAALLSLGSGGHGMVHLIYLLTSYFLSFSVALDHINKRKKPENAARFLRNANYLSACSRVFIRALVLLCPNTCVVL